jgi:hypothetical protein
MSICSREKIKSCIWQGADRYIGESCLAKSLEHSAELDMPWQRAGLEVPQIANWLSAVIQENRKLAPHLVRSIAPWAKLAASEVRCFSPCLRFGKGVSGQTCFQYSRVASEPSCTPINLLVENHRILIAPNGPASYGCNESESGDFKKNNLGNHEIAASRKRNDHAGN